MRDCALCHCCSSSNSDDRSIGFISMRTFSPSLKMASFSLDASPSIFCQPMHTWVQSAFATNCAASDLLQMPASASQNSLMQVPDTHRVSARCLPQRSWRSHQMRTTPCRKRVLRRRFRCARQHRASATSSGRSQSSGQCPIRTHCVCSPEL